MSHSTKSLYLGTKILERTRKWITCNLFASQHKVADLNDYFCMPMQKLYKRTVKWHSVLEEVLTPQIYKMIVTPIFSSGKVVGVIAYAQFCPIPSLLVSFFLLAQLAILLRLYNVFLYYPSFPNSFLEKTISVVTELDKTEHREWFPQPIPT